MIDLFVSIPYEYKIIILSGIVFYLYLCITKQN